MDMPGLFVVEVVGALRESREVMRSRVSHALDIDEVKAAALVARMPGVITRPLPETRAAKVALRLQAAGVSAVHRPLVPAAAVELPPEPVAAVSDAADAPHESASSPLSDVPSIDATLIEEPDVDPKLTPMTEGGFGAADVVIPFVPKPAWPTSTARPGRSTIVEGGATAAPGPAQPPRPLHGDAAPDGLPLAAAERTDHADLGDAERLGTAERLTHAERLGATEDDDVAITMVRAVDDEPGSRYQRSERPTPVPTGSAPAPSGSAPAPRLPGDERALTTRERAYRSTRSSAETPLTLSAPPDEVQQRSGVRQDVLEVARARRRGAFGRRLSSLVTVPLFVAWAASAGFMWLLLPPEGRFDLWLPLAAAAAVAALVGVLVANIATGRLGRDVTALRDEAERLAMGDLSKPVALGRDDDLGDLAESVERLRVSLLEALERLRRRR
jgi:HAMP domain-containing protein